MNSKTLRAKYLKFTILIISICFILGAISACLPFNISVPTLGNDAISNTVATITQNSSDNLGEFNDGYSYVYTDKTKIDGYRAGTEVYDITTHKVAKTSTNRGTQDNPYVIATTADWETFVKRMASDTTYGAGQYFVLGKDLDFDGVDFYPVINFNGTFYGVGHSLKNITCSSWKYWNASTNAYVDINTSNIAHGGFGVFGQILGATITDLIVQDYSFQNIPQNTTCLDQHGPFVGGIAGFSYGNNVVLNCHTSGEITSNLTYTSHPICGGIIGDHGLVNTDLLVYRCSSEFYSSLKTNGYVCLCGGMVGDCHLNTTVHLYDCASNFRLDFVGTSYNHASVAIGWVRGKTSVIENVVGSLDITSTVRHFSGALAGTADPVTIINNAYVEGNIGTPGANKNSIQALTRTTAGITSSNVNVVKSSTSYAPLHSQSNDALGANVITYSSADLMIASAKTFFGTNYPQIWDTSKIGGTYDPDNSPVRNYLMAFVNFRNLNNGGNSEESVGLPDGDGYIVGEKLPDETSTVSAFATYLTNKKNSNHEFLGWTDDPTGKSEPFTELPSGYFGDVTLYVVWGLPDSYVNSNIKTSLSVDKNLIEYDSVASITLTAKVEHTAPSSGAMTNPKPTYYFVQDGEEKTTSANVKSSGVLSVKTVKDSGKYTFKYRLTDGLEPLWFYDGEYNGNAETLTIEKGKLEHMTIKDFKISSLTAPYYGKELKDVDFSVKMYNNANKEVELATETP
ncbi:MAG: hypothetical protein K2O86_01700, partial [Clostridia bacterium]|nr:hypothetical protein [Clostridia bacterium]